MKVETIRQIIAGLEDNAEVYVGYDDNNELEFDMFTEEDIISRANNQAGNEEELIEDIDTALSYLMEQDYTYHFME